MGCRQGDPGSTRYFLSLEDNLFRIFGGDRIKGLMSAFQVEDLPIESGMLTKSLDEAQRKARPAPCMFASSIAGMPWVAALQAWLHVQSSHMRNSLTGWPR